MTYYFRYVFAFLVLVSLSACEKDEVIEATVDSRLQVYFDRFVSEGALRGKTIDFAAIPVSGQIESIDQNNVQGQCQTNSARPNVLIVDIGFWDNSSDIEKEFVIFHELGHCYLDRNHLDTQDGNGVCQSMMHSGTSGCTNNYNLNTRSDYLDELFMN